LSLKQSELIAIDADQIRITEAHFLEALSEIIPHVSFVSKDFQQSKAQTALSSISGAQDSKTSERKFNATQTLFNGFKAIAAIKGSGYERHQRTYEKIRAEQLLLVDVANAFYLLLEERDDIKVLERTKEALSGRVKELIDRERLGRSKPSEVVNAKAQFYSVEASLEAARSREVIVRQLLEFLVGRQVGRIRDTYEFPAKLMTEGHYVSMSSSRPDVEAARFAWQLSKENIRVVDSDFLPSADVEANYYAQRTNSSKGIDWDVLFTVNVPIFEGTEVLGRSKAANLEADQDRLLFHRAKRQAPYDIKDAYVRLTTAMTVRDALRKAYTTAKLNYYLQKRDYRRSLVNNLDVLASIQTLQDAERNYIHALYEAKRQYWQLRVAVGQGLTS